MNRMLRKLLSLALTLALMLGLTAFAAAYGGRSVVLKIDSPYCTLDNTVTTVDPANKNVIPTIIDNRTMLPIRMLIEHFGGTVGWNGDTRQVTCSLGGRSVVLTIDSTTALVNGQETTLDVPATIRDGRTLVPVRFVSESLLLNVAWEGTNRLVVVSTASLPADSESILALQSVRALLDKLNAPSPVTLKTERYTLESGTVNAKVVTVNLKDSSVRIEAQHVDNTLNHTALFSDIVAGSDAEVIINANFFNAYDEIQDPIGTLMCGGEFLYCNSGLPSVGFTDDNRVYWGNPSVFVNVNDTSYGSTWAAYTVNTLEHGYDISVLYTPARGSSVPITVDGRVMVATNGKISAYESVVAGDEVTIPSDGFVLYMGPGFTSTNYFRTPVVGGSVKLNPFLRVADSEGFVLSGVRSIISGAPRLVKDGEMFYELIPGFEEDRFTTAVTPRTAIGTTADGKLLIVSVNAASIQQMRELMLELGCQDATNLDGGGSTALYCQGKTLATPGRQLTSTLHIFVD